MAESASEGPRLGPLIIIGGHEHKIGDRVILREVAAATSGRLVIAIVASEHPERYFETCVDALTGLRVGALVELPIDQRAQANDEATLAFFDDAGGVFFSGGDQLWINSQIGDTAVERKIRDIWHQGGVLAGAPVLSATMLPGGAGDESYRVGELRMVRDGRLRVIGSGGVHVLDGEDATTSNVAEATDGQTLSTSDLRLHVAASGDGFDLEARRALTAASFLRVNLDHLDTALSALLREPDGNARARSVVRYAARRLLNPRSPLRVHVRRELDEAAQVAVTLGVVEAAADHEFVQDFEAHVPHRHLDLRGIVEQLGRFA